jgi:hypothetical protein
MRSTCSAGAWRPQLDRYGLPSGAPHLISMQWFGL